MGLYDCMYLIPKDQYEHYVTNGGVGSNRNDNSVDNARVGGDINRSQLTKIEVNNGGSLLIGESSVAETEEGGDRKEEKGDKLSEQHYSMKERGGKEKKKKKQQLLLEKQKKVDGGGGGPVLPLSRSLGYHPSSSQPGWIPLSEVKIPSPSHPSSSSREVPMSIGSIPSPTKSKNGGTVSMNTAPSQSSRARLNSSTSRSPSSPLSSSRVRISSPTISTSKRRGGKKKEKEKDTNAVRMKELVQERMRQLQGGFNVPLPSDRKQIRQRRGFKAPLRTARERMRQLARGSKVSLPPDEDQDQDRVRQLQDGFNVPLPQDQMETAAAIEAHENQMRAVVHNAREVYKDVLKSAAARKFGGSSRSSNSRSKNSTLRAISSRRGGRGREKGRVKDDIVKGRNRSSNYVPFSLPNSPFFPLPPPQYRERKKKGPTSRKLTRRKLDLEEEDGQDEKDLLERKRVKRRQYWQGDDFLGKRDASHLPDYHKLKRFAREYDEDGDVIM